MKHAAWCSDWFEEYRDACDRAFEAKLTALVSQSGKSPRHQAPKRSRPKATPKVKAAGPKRRG